MQIINIILSISLILFLSWSVLDFVKNNKNIVKKIKDTKDLTLINLDNFLLITRFYCVLFLFIGVANTFSADNIMESMYIFVILFVHAIISHLGHKKANPPKKDAILYAITSTVFIELELVMFYKLQFPNIISNLQLSSTVEIICTLLLLYVMFGLIFLIYYLIKKYKKYRLR